MTEWTGATVVAYWRKELNVGGASRVGGYWCLQRGHVKVQVQIINMGEAAQLRVRATAVRRNARGDKMTSTASSKLVHNWSRIFGDPPIHPSIVIRRAMDELEDLTRWVKQPSIATPEPAPANSGEPIPELLVEWLEAKIENPQAIISDVRARAEFGFQKYGQYLMSNDGRDTINDARQEAIDLLKYLYKARLNNENVSDLKDVLGAIVALYKDSTS